MTIKEQKQLIKKMIGQSEQPLIKKKKSVKKGNSNGKR